MYFGGIRLYKAELVNGKWTVYQVKGVHVDQKDLRFSPHNANTYWITNDGGIWKCTLQYNTYDTVQHRNEELRTVMFFDIDVYPTDYDYIIGGTQDNGTILYEGNDVWKGVRGGDGLYSLIAPTNKSILYSQHQFLRDTYQSRDGGNTWRRKNVNNGLPASNRWGAFDAYITVHPNGTDHVLAEGQQVLSSTDGGVNWFYKGPSLTGQNHYVRRITFQPGTCEWIAGTSRGEIWYSSTGGQGFWSRADSRWFDVASVSNIAFSTNNSNVFYVTYDGGDDYRRIQRFEYNSSGFGSWNGTYITDNLPSRLKPTGDDTQGRKLVIYAIAADGFDDATAYVGTNQGVFRGHASSPHSNWNWQPYNSGMPLTSVHDLVVDKTNMRLLHAATWERSAFSVVTGP